MITTCEWARRVREKLEEDRYTVHPLEWKDGQQRTSHGTLQEAIEAARKRDDVEPIVISDERTHEPVRLFAGGWEWEYVGEVPHD